MERVLTVLDYLANTAPNQGSVDVVSGISLYGGNEVSFTTVQASFWAASQAQVEVVDRPVGENCVVRTSSVFDPGVYSARAGAGTLDIAGLAQPVQMVEAADHSYAPYDSDPMAASSYFVEGNDVTVSAAGGDVPAFELTASTPEQNLTVSAPPTPVMGEVETLPLGEDRRTEWDPVQRGVVVVTLQKLDGPDAGALLACSRLGEPLINEMVVPLSEVDEFNAGSALETVLYGDWQRTQAGVFEVQLALRAPVLGTKGEFYGARLVNLVE